MAGFQHLVNARPVDTESLCALNSPDPGHVYGHVYRGRAALVDAFGLRLGDAFQLTTAWVGFRGVVRRSVVPRKKRARRSGQ
jgi:hypothetical protein